MKKIILLAILFTTITFSQTADTTYINGDSLKSGNIQIFENWDYHAGDDGAWALPAFSSVRWGNVDCRLFVDSLNEGDWIGIGWFRKTIVIDSSLMNKNVAMTLNHYGASQFYIDGKLINNFGTVSDSSENEKIYYSNSEPIIINFDSSSTYLLTVRYSNHLPIDYPYLYKRFRNTVGFYATFKNWNEGVNYYGVTQANDTAQNAALFGIFLSISIIYLLLFLFYSKQKEYLYYTIFTFSIALSFASDVLVNIVHSDLAFYFVATFTSRYFALAIFLSVLAFLYQIFYARMLKLFRYLLMIGIAVYILQLVIGYGDIARKIYLGIVFVISIEILRVIFLAIKNKKNNAWVIGTGVCVFAGFFLFLITLLVIGAQFNNFYIILIFLFSIPLSMSIYLARSSSQTNKNLEIQLTTVKHLSEEAIEHEKKSAKLEMETQLMKAENERKTKELEQARQLQLSMLPKEIPQLPNLDVAVHMKTATEVGGDYYDFHIHMDGTLTVVLGDATGHGMMSGMMVSIMKSLFMSDRTNKALKPFFENASASIKDMQLGRLMMALTCVQISNNEIKTTNAGMPPLFIYRNNLQTVEEIAINNMPLGAMKEVTYDVREVNIEKGDTLLLMSDGFAELKNQNEEIYGYKRARNSFKEVAKKNPEEIVIYLSDEGKRWTNNKEPDDDVTFVVIKVK